MPPIANVELEVFNTTPVGDVVVRRSVFLAFRSEADRRMRVSGGKICFPGKHRLAGGTEVMQLKSDRYSCLKHYMRLPTHGDLEHGRGIGKAGAAGSYRLVRVGKVTVEA